MSSPQWTEWKPLVIEAPPGDSYVLTELLDGGQAFRWYRQQDATWLGMWGGCVAKVSLGEAGFFWRAPVTLAPIVEKEIGRYFGGEQNHVASIDQLPWRSDAHLALCLNQFPGLRILRQPFGETLLAFLCSATKQIIQIKQMLSLLATRHGAALIESDEPESERRMKPVASNVANETMGPRMRRLPTWDELAEVSEADLRLCLLGFRARYIHKVARFLAAHPGWLEATEQMPYLEAKERLCTLPGVGEKVADCTLLFGAGRLEAFPVDVWILKAMAKRYGLEHWKPDHVAQFGRMHFGTHAGLAQQYLFAFERRNG
jgi:N-glycosylase/DNA lyase